MFDVDVAFREWLTSSAAVTALVPAAHIVAGDLPLAAKPGAGEQWITFRSRGGKRHSEIKDWIDESFAVTCWAQFEGDLAARAIYRAISDLIYATQSQQVAEATIAVAQEEVAGQDVTDPATQWAMCVGYILVSMHT
jgi:hypothetical protein